MAYYRQKNLDFVWWRDGNCNVKVLAETIMLSLKKALVVAAAVTGLSGAMAAQTELERQLAEAVAPQNGAATKGGKASAAPANGWVVPNDGSKADAPCSMLFRSSGSSAGYLGPFAGSDIGYFFVAGPKIPYTSAPKTISVALITDGDPEQKVRAFNYPVRSDTNAILFQLTDFPAAVDMIDDRESVAVILRDKSFWQNGQSVFSSSWTGAHAAREKLRACLAKKAKG